MLTGEERGPIDDAIIDMKGVSRILTQAMLYKPESKERAEDDGQRRETGLTARP